MAMKLWELRNWALIKAGSVPSPPTLDEAVMPDHQREYFRKRPAEWERMAKYFLPSSPNMPQPYEMSEHEGNARLAWMLWVKRAA